MIAASFIVITEKGSSSGEPLEEQTISFPYDQKDWRISDGSDFDFVSGESFISTGTMEPATRGSRVSDSENEVDLNDYANGSRIDSSGEIITGSLSYDPSGESDRRDWYKLSAIDVDPSPGATNGPRNISITLTSYLDGNDGRDDLHEYCLIPSSTPGEYEPEHDYYDFIMVHVLYYDPWRGIHEIGGTNLHYDDGDPSDSYEPSENWTFRFSTPVPSTGPEDLDGFNNGLDEVGWYYISYTMLWGEKEGAPQREGFSVHYQFDIDTDDRDLTDDGANVREEAGSYGNGPKRLQSAFDQVDWYSFKGQDDEKLWKMNFTVNRTLGAGYVDQNNQIVKDTYQYFFVLTPDAGNDGLWNTEDDTYSYFYWIFTFFISNSLTVESGTRIWFEIENTWTSANDRSILIGTYVKPVTASYEGSEITGFYNSEWTTFSDYTIDVEITEESINRQPIMGDLKVTSDNPFHETGGDLSDTFTFEVDYIDPDGDEPLKLDLYVDPGTRDEKVFTMMGDDDGEDVKTGRRYHLEMKGEDIGIGEHDLMANCSDDTEEGSMRRSLDSTDIYLNDTLEVWDDDAVDYMPGNGPDPLYEDEGRVMIPLEYHNGGWFDDPERSFSGFRVWNGTMGDWSDESLQEIIRVEIVYREGDGWYASVEPVKDMHGTELMRIRAFDDHSHLDRNVSIDVLSVNDPPLLDRIEFNGEGVEFEDTDPLEIEVDLRSKEIREDEEFKLNIYGMDSDPEEDRTPIRYSLIDTGKGDFSEIPVIDPSTGEMRFTPFNSDVGRNSWMKFEISDGTDSIEVRVMMDVLNSPDDPVLSLSTNGATVYQGASWTLEAECEDVDPDEEFTYSVNGEQEMGDVESISDQLHADVLGTDMGFNFDPSTGVLSISPVGDDIWRTSTSLVEEARITIAVKVTDRDGRSDVAVTNLTMLKDGPWIPEVPDYTVDVKDEDPVEPGDQGMTVNVKAEDIDPSYGEGWVYTWSTGDGNEITGKEFTHTYETTGDRVSFTYNIKLKLVRGDHSTSEVSRTVTLSVPGEEEVEREGSDMTVYGIIAAVAVVLLILILILLVMIRKRSKPVESAPMGTVDPGITPAIPVSEVKGSVSPEKIEEVKDRVSCPNCGAPVMKDWFLCPECKNTLNW